MWAILVFKKKEKRVATERLSLYSNRTLRQPLMLLLCIILKLLITATGKKKN